MNFENPMDGNEYYTLNIEKCINDKTLPTVLRMLFVELRDCGYVHVGKFFGEMSRADLDTLRMLADYTHPDNEDVTEEEEKMGYETMALLGMALMTGEGHELSEENCENGLKLALSYTAIETLYREGLVEVFRDNWSMVGDDTMPIVKLKDQ